MKRFVVLGLCLFIVVSAGLFISHAAQYNQIVYQAQKALKGLGYNPGPIDGLWGNKTQRALQRFQRDNNLPLTGRLDELTKAKLDTASSSRSTLAVIPGSKTESTTLKDEIDLEKKQEILKQKRRELDHLRIEIEKRKLDLELKRLEDEKQKLEAAKLPPKQKYTPSAFETDVVERDGRRYIKYRNGVVFDTKTGIEWIAGPDKDTSWDEAKLWVENLSIDDDDWRMPSIEELMTLYRNGAGPSNITPLINISGTYAWSSETKDYSKAYTFNFRNGSRILASRNDSIQCRVFAVRIRKKAKHSDSTQVGSETRFSVNNNYMVLDTMTGLEWKAGPDKDTTWQESNDWVRSLAIGGGGWRMPTIEELRSLYQEGAGDKSIIYLLKLSEYWVWSSEKKDSSAAWFFDFSEGRKSWFNRNSRKYKRGFAVRYKR